MLASELFVLSLCTSLKAAILPSPLSPWPLVLAALAWADS
jgi:hypothetical protein